MYTNLSTRTRILFPPKKHRTRYRYAARKGIREFSFGYAMDPREAGKLGGRPEMVHINL